MDAKPTERPGLSQTPERQTASDTRDLRAEQDRIREQTGGGRDLVVKETSELWDEGAMRHKGMQRQKMEARDGRRAERIGTCI